MGNIIVRTLFSHTNLKCCILLNNQFVRHKEKLPLLDQCDSSMPTAKKKTVIIRHQQMEEKMSAFII